MVTVELKNVKIYGYHGLYEGEDLTGGSLELNLQVSYPEGEAGFDYITETVDYGVLYSIVREEMKQPVPLLEKAAAGIIQRVKKQFPHIQEVILSVYKLNPPIENFSGRAGVILQKRFHG